MDKLLRIELRNHEVKIATFGFIQLDPASSTSARKFWFHKLIFDSDIKYEYSDKIDLVVFHDSKFGWQQLYLKKLYVLDTDAKGGREWVLCLLNDFDEVEYKQGIIEVFNSWQEGKKIDWWSFDDNSERKDDYLNACLLYSSVNGQILDKKEYKVDFEFVKNEKDFLFVVAEEFYGSRGYFGWSIYTFEDCLREIKKVHKENNSLVVFQNVNKTLSDLSLVHEVRVIFERYGFKVSIL